MNVKTFTALAGLSAFALVALVAATCGSGSTTVQNGDNQPHGVSVAGEGKVQGKPDLALLSLGVSALADDVASARDRESNELDSMIASMKKNGVADKDIQTQQLNIAPEYDYSAGKQLLKDFRVSNSVTAKVRDINATGRVVDDAVNAGGNDVQIQAVSFTIDKPDDLQRQAREQAIADARDKADTLAKASGVSLGDAISITEGGGVQPVPATAAFDRAAGAAAPQTPIQPGELDVTVTVNVTWAIK